MLLSTVAVLSQAVQLPMNNSVYKAHCRFFKKIQGMSVRPILRKIRLKQLMNVGLRDVDQQGKLMDQVYEPINWKIICSLFN